MSDHYRQKLLNWYCSIMLLLLICTLAACVLWYEIFSANSTYGLTRFDQIAMPISDVVLSYYVLFLPLAFWHFFDFLEGPKQSEHWLTSYPGLLALLLITTPFAIFGITNFVGVLNCQARAGGFMLFNCASLSFSGQVLVSVSAPLMVIACISKAITSVFSRLK